MFSSFIYVVDFYELEGKMLFYSSSSVSLPMIQSKVTRFATTLETEI